MKYISTAILASLLVACSPDFSQDKNYVHIRKDKTACKAITRQEHHPSKSNPYVEVKSKCVYYKTTTEPLPPTVDPELVELLQELDSNA